MADKNESSYYDHLVHERDHMEGLVNQRFNFFMIVFGFILAAPAYVVCFKQFRLVIIIGFLIELALTLLIGRAQLRLGINIKMLYRFRHKPHKIIWRVARKAHRLNPFRYGMVKLMGYIIPIAITSILFLMVLVSFISPNLIECLLICK